GTPRDPLRQTGKGPGTRAFASARPDAPGGALRSGVSSPSFAPHRGAGLARPDSEARGIPRRLADAVYRGAAARPDRPRDRSPARPGANGWGRQTDAALAARDQQRPHGDRA